MTADGAGGNGTGPHACRFCGTPLRHTFADLGVSPLANSYLEPDDLERMEPFYPLHAYVCESCYLVQLPAVETAERIFGEYAYFSSYVDALLESARRYVAAATDRFGIGPEHQVVEVASNDGYLLQYFAERGVPVLGVEPARNVAEAARGAGIPTLVRFFGEKTARDLVTRGTRADLLIANNVLAHVPDLNDFVEGIRVALAPGGVATLEFPHLLQLMSQNQFDTIYHEHFSYFSFTTAERVFAAHGLTVFDVEEIPLHGGSLRIYARHADDEGRPVERAVADLRSRETEARLDRMEPYLAFGARVQETKRKFLAFLLAAKARGKSVAGYGAPAKANTLLNYCGVRSDLLDYTVDRSPHKRGRFLPGTRIPIYGPEHLERTKPDYVVILPWNLKDEVMGQMACVRSWGGRFVVPIPEPTICG